MPLTNNAPALIQKRPGFTTIVLITGAGLFILSLFFNCFCTDKGCRPSIDALVLGWAEMFEGNFAWLANPLLIVSWILLGMNKKGGMILALLASLFSLSFLFCHTIMEDEAGNMGIIKNVTTGYWLWVGSCVVTYVGALVGRVNNRKITG
ncbi:hypothetical protein A3860_09565 [Niastella vici]|uniref:Uncharacterized protein n=1 Tax=Niastella vici TaxID=1703345 RepID=A0A1V9FEN7_9BACT|nr:hypothetical protein [Niastella vici]OQP56822.1 hypothetical protein A3860_09565 [Niastella vici]